MAQQDFVKTGIKGLDELLSGGIPRGNIVLLEGTAGTGKTTLGVEFIYRGIVESGEPGLVVLFEVSPEKVARDAAGFGWNLSELEQSDQLKIIFTTREVFNREIQQADSLLLEEAHRIGARRMFIDGFVLAAPEESGNGSRGTREQFHVFAEGLHREQLTAMIGTDLVAQGENSEGSVPEELVADTIIRLRLEPFYRAVQRTIEIVKSRGHDFHMGRHSFSINDQSGVQVYRRVQAPRGTDRDNAGAFDTTVRLPTGVPGLDELVNGGYFLGSTTLVVGISGVGKSVMALQFMAEGIRREERSLMLTLDEPAAQVMRNATSVGFEFESAINRGIMEIWYEPPQELDLDRHFHDVERKVREFQPKRVVIDSLSTYGANLGSRGRLFRDFFHALVALMKQRQIVAVYNHENPEMLGMSSMMGEFALSSLVDNILLMNWVELGESFRLGLTVAKMRANPVFRTTREYEIVSPGGVRILSRDAATALPVTPFSQYYGLISRAPERRRPRRYSPEPDADSDVPH
jgi:circadian clock protein KaiC